METEWNAEAATESRTDDSAVLRDFYERMPYPAPLVSLDEHRELYRNPERRRALFYLLFPSERPRAGMEILVAGCGTSQAARYALREPDARVTGIDVSETSLAHTRTLQEKYKLENLMLHRLSILDVPSLGRTFDHIVCTGVLHHLLDPDAGLLALRSVLKRDGAMQIMVYGSYGRTGIYMIREYCHMLGIATSSKELFDLRATLQALPKNHPMTHLLDKNKDFELPTAWQMRSFIRKIVRTACPRFTHGLTDAGCRLGGGLSRLPTFRSADRWQERLMQQFCTNSRRASSMQRSNSFEEPSHNTISLRIV